MQIDDLIKELQDVREKCIKDGWKPEDIYVKVRNLMTGRTSYLGNIDIEEECVKIDVDFD